MAQEMAAENDHIPQPERPLIRQPLGFSIDQPANSINTYEANTSAPTQNGVFLPGQEVPSSPKLKKLKGKKRSCTKRPRRPDAFAGQTSRFRLQTYDPTPNGDPPTHNGSGPYSSMYRGVAPPAETGPDLPVTASLQSPTSSSTASSNTMVSFGPFSSFRSSQENPFAPKGSAAAATSKGKSTQPLATSPFSCSRFQQFTNDIGSTSLGGPYYRHNYESHHKHASSLSPSRRQSAQSETQRKWGPITRSQGYPPAASISSRGTDNEEAEGLELNLLVVFLTIYHSSRPVTKAFTHGHRPHPRYS